MTLAALELVAFLAALIAAFELGLRVGRRRWHGFGRRPAGELVELAGPNRPARTNPPITLQRAVGFPLTRRRRAS